MAAVGDLAEARGLLAKGRIDESAVGRKKRRRGREGGKKRKLEIRCVPQMGALIVAHFCLSDCECTRYLYLAVD